MRKQTLLASAMAAMFILAAAGASFAADRRGPNRGHHYGNGKHFAAKPHNGNWKRHPAPRHSRGWRDGRHTMPRHRMQHRSPNYRPRFHTPRHPNAHRPNDHYGWRERSSNHYRPGNSDRRPTAGYGRRHAPAGDGFTSPRNGGTDYGNDRARQSYDGRERSDRQQTDGRVASDDDASRRGGRSNTERQRQL